MTVETDIAIVGAGLSGLALATSLQAEGRDVAIFDARDRAGGRVLSEQGYDLGPAWIWPENKRMLALTRSLGIKVFRQFSSGRLVFEEANGAVRRDLDFATMGQALRIEGGLSRITDALAASLGPALRLGSAAKVLKEDQDGVSVAGDGFSIRAERVVLALPPRLAAPLGVASQDVPTWMAGQAKLIARYAAPFWREQGLNGDAISRRGPLMEIHDASPPDGEEGALFGFVAPGAARNPGFRASALDQLARLFGQEAANPLDVIVKDWSVDPYTATEQDRAFLPGHPTYPPQTDTARIFFAGSETAGPNAGFLEGALEAAETAHKKLTRQTA